MPIPPLLLRALHVGGSYTSWLHNSSLYFNASPSVAKLYWQTFLAIHRSSYALPCGPTHAHAHSHAHAATHAAAATGPTQIPLPSIRLEVDLHEFMLFLLLQRFDGTRATPAVGSAEVADASSPTELRLQFLLHHLQEILLLCRDVDRLDANALTAHEFNRIAILVQGLAHPRDAKEIRSIAELTPFYTSAAATAAQQQQMRHAQQNTETTPTPSFAVPIHTLVNWLRAQLNRPAVSLSLALSMSDETPIAGSDHDEHKVDSLALLPVVELHSIRARTVFLRRADQSEDMPPVSPSPSSALSSASIAAGTSSTVDRCIHPGSFVHLRQCADASFLMSVVSRFVTVSDGRNLVLQLGVVSHQLQLNRCVDCVIWVVAPSTSAAGIGSNIHLVNCRNVKIFLYTNGCVQILNEAPANDEEEATTTTSLTVNTNEARAGCNSGITLAPYNTAYADLEDDLASVGFVLNRQSCPTNTWSTVTAIEPIVLPTKQSSSQAHPSPQSVTSPPTSPEPLSSGAAIPSKQPAPPQSAAISIASGGRKSKALMQHTSSSALSPIYLTFPTLATVGASSPRSPVSPAAPSSAASPDVTLLPPAQFFPSSFSVGPASSRPRSSRRTTRNPFPLPAEFTAALARRQSQAVANRAMIDKAHLSPSQQHSLQAIIQHEFQAWLAVSYPKYLLANLLRADEERIRLTSAGTPGTPATSATAHAASS